MNRIFTLLLLYFLPLYLLSQDTDISKLYITATESGKFVFAYPVSPGETAYSLSRKFNQSVSSIQSVNPDKKLRNLAPNDMIYVPFEKEILSEPNESSLIAFVYKTQPKETLYAICKRYFDIPIKKITSINNLKSYDLAVDQELIIGYLGSSSNRAKSDEESSLETTQANVNNGELSYQESEPVTIIVKETQPKKKYRRKSRRQNEEVFTLSDLIDMIDDENEYEEEKMTSLEEVEEELVYTEQKGIAYTENISMDGEDLFVLHPNAQIGSEMIISFPMLNTSVKAKVISEIPKELYPKNISIVISPTVAEALGAKDDQFRVEMKYITN